MKKVNCIMLILISASLVYTQNWIAIDTTGNPSGDVRAMYWDEVDSLTYIVGTFKYLNGVEVNGACKYDGQQIFPLNSGFDHFISIVGSTGMEAIIRYQNKLYFGHAWASVDSVLANGIATWDGENWHPVGEGLTNFEETIPGDFSGAGLNMEIYKDDLYVAGWFDMAGTDTTQNIARWDGENWHAVAHPYDNQGFSGFYDLRTFKDYLYVCGNFDTPDNKRSIVRYDGENWETVGIGILGGIDVPLGMIVYQDELYIYGFMRKATGNAGNKIMKLENDEWVDVGGGVMGNTTRVTDALVLHDKLYLVGVFTHVGDSLYFPNLAAWDGEKWCSTGTDFQGFQGPNIALSRIERFEDDILASGNFYTIDGDSITKVARWVGGEYLEECGEIVSTTNEINHQELTVFPNPTNSEIHLNLKGIPSNELSTATILDTYGKKIAKYQLNSSPNHQIDVKDLPAGIYFLKITTDNQIFSQKFIKQ